MINTYSGEKIEPRVGDALDFDGKQFTYLIKDLCTGCISEDGIDFYDEEDCTLLHRPFQVGDEYEYPGQEGVFSFVVESESLLPLECIHKNPSWRDHPDYEGKK